MFYANYKCIGGCGYDLYIQLDHAKEGTSGEYICEDCENNQYIMTPEKISTPRENTLTFGVKYEKKKWNGCKFIKK